MALLCFPSSIPLYSSLPFFSFASFASSSSSSSTLPIVPAAVPRLHSKPIFLGSKSSSGVQISKFFTARKIGAVIVRAESDGGGAASAEGGESPAESAESKKEVVSVDKLPLESKLQERQEQRLRMKMAKKIRLRRKRLVRKRRMRKKGRWPPSKMKKLKNV